MTGHAQVEELARLHDRSLSARDFPPGRLVLIRKADGTEVLYRDAFLMRHEDWVVVFTESRGYFCFATEILADFAQFDERPEIGAL